MPTLTVTEKEHWKGRIARRIDKKIEALTASDPNFFDRIDRQARQRALESLGLKPPPPCSPHTTCPSGWLRRRRPFQPGMVQIRVTAFEPLTVTGDVVTPCTTSS